jgi:hypothetical protein
VGPRPGGDFVAPGKNNAMDDGDTRNPFDREEKRVGINPVPAAARKKHLQRRARNLLSLLQFVINVMKK